MNRPSPYGGRADGDFLPKPKHPLMILYPEDARYLGEDQFGQEIIFNGKVIETGWYIDSKPKERIDTLLTGLLKIDQRVAAVDRHFAIGAHTPPVQLLPG